MQKIRSVLVGALAFTGFGGASAHAANAINVIAPYRHQGQWVFDDPARGLVREPFVAGADTWIDRATAAIPGAGGGFLLIFSDRPFPSSQFELTRRRMDSGGAWYYSPTFEMEGWLCSALLRYFPQPPAKLYAQVKARS